MGTVCSTHGGMRNVYRNFVENLEGKESLGQPIRKNNINIIKILNKQGAHLSGQGYGTLSVSTKLECLGLTQGGRMSHQLSDQTLQKSSLLVYRD